MVVWRLDRLADPSRVSSTVNSRSPQTLSDPTAATSGSPAAQVSVDPAHARRGVGRALIETAETWAREHAFNNITLTTFEHVPWNAPYYARLGFVVLPEHEQPAQLQEIRRAEAASGLDAWPRVAMRRQL